MGINKIKISPLFIFFCLTILSCQNNKMEEKFQWSATVSAPQEFPVEIYSGAIIANDYTGDFSSIWGTLNSGWGNTGGTMGNVDKEIEIPHTLEFTWFSLVENKFYTGNWKIDQKKIIKLFQKGLTNRLNGSKGNYNEFKIGLAPQGRVALWIGGEGYQKEVGFFQAHDTIIKKQEAYDNAKYMFETNYATDMLNNSDFKTFKNDVKERSLVSGYPDPKIYEQFRENYDWKPTINLPDGYKLNGGTMLLCNGEWTDLDDEEKKAVPYYINFYVIGKDLKEYNFDISFTKNENYYKNYLLQGNDTLPVDFDLNEIYKIFNKALNQNLKIDLIIDVFPDMKKIKIKLVQDQTENFLNEFKTSTW